MLGKVIMSLFCRTVLMGSALILVCCAGEMSTSLTNHRIPQVAWRAGDVVRLKRPLLYVLMEENAYIDHPLPDFDISKGTKPYTPYDSAQMIEKGVSLKVVRVTKSSLPNSVGGTSVFASILDGALAGRRARISAGQTPLLYFKGEHFMVPDPEYFEIISRGGQNER